MEWSEAIERYLNRVKVQYSRDYWKENKSKLNLLRAWCEEKGIDVGAFTDRDMDKYLADRKGRPGRRGGSLSRRSIESDAQRAKLFFRWLREQRLIERDPLERYKAPSAPRAYVQVPDVNYLERLLQAIVNRNDVRRNEKIRCITPRKRRFLRLRDVSLFMGLIETGCRVTEICQLRLEDVDFKEKKVTFRETKGQEPRTVPAADDWLRTVKEWLEVRPDVPDCATLYMSDIGTPMTRDSVRHQQEQYEKFGDLPHYTRHSIRHFRATAVVAKNPRSAQLMLGHKKIETTMRYDHTTMDQVRRDMEAAAAISRVQAPSTRRKRVI